MFRRLMILTLVLCLPAVAPAGDEETQRLEAYAVCHAQPYRCPPGALMTPEERAQDAVCDRLTPHRALIASKIRHREPLDSADLAAQQTWQNSCQGWEHQHRTRQPQSSPRPEAFLVPTVPPPTVTCWTDTWGWGLTSGSRTTCTSY
jgi:hypothetical protein